MRHIAKLFVIAAATSIVGVPLAHAADSSDSATDSQGHVRQHQDAVPPSPAQNPESRRDPSAPNQSAEAPQSPSVITPPSTGDKSVITPPATNAAKTPVITPPGTSNNNRDEIQPK
jgi:apolipoprotein N-acyltransferase